MFQRGAVVAKAHVAQRREAAEGGGRSHNFAAEKDREWQREKQRLMRKEA